MRCRGVLECRREGLIHACLKNTPASSAPQQISRALFDKNSEAEQRALRLAKKHVLTDTDILSSNFAFKTVTRNVTSGDVYLTTKKVCEISSIGVFAMLTMTSCPMDLSIQSLGESLNVPVLQIGKGYCGSPRLTGKYFFSSRPSEELILQALAQYLSANRIKTMVICYEEGTDTTKIQRLLTTLTRAQRLDVVTTLLQIPLTIKNDVAQNSDVINSFYDIIKNDGRRIYDAVLVFAKPEITIPFLSKVSVNNVAGATQQKWIIANAELRADHLRQLKRVTQSSVTVIKHSINKNDPQVQKFVSGWNNEEASDCPNCEPLSSEADDIPITAYYLYDGVRHLCAALTAFLNDGWKSPFPLMCQDSSTQSWGGGKFLMEKIQKVNSSGLLGPMKLNTQGYQSFASFEIYTKISGPNEEFRKVADWSSQAANQTMSRDTIPRVAASNKTFRVVTLREPPFVFVDDTITGQGRFSGFSIDLLRGLADGIGFQYNLYEVADGKYGEAQSDGSWDGLVGDVVNGEADFAISALTITSERERAIDFTRRYMDYSVGFVMKKPQQDTELFSFVYPFHLNVWICIGSSLILVVALIFVLNRVSPHGNQIIRRSERKRFGLIQCFWYVYSSLMQQGADLKMISLPARVVTGFWWFFALIVVSSYTANLAAILTVTRAEAPFRNFDDLVAKGADYGTVKGSAVYQYITSKGAEATDETSFYKKMSKVISKAGNSMPNSAQGFNTASNDYYAFLWDAAIIQYKVLTSEDCTLTTVSDTLYDKGYGIALEHGSPFTDMLSMRILRLQESGDLDKLVSKWWPKEGNCPLDMSRTEIRGAALTLQNFAGVFGILAAGLLIALLLGVIEIITHIRKGRPYPPADRQKKKSSSIMEHDVTCTILDSQTVDENILVVLKKKDILQYLSEGDNLKRSAGIAESNLPPMEPSAWREATNGNQGMKHDSPSVIGSLCCHAGQTARKQKSPTDDDRAVLSSEQLQRIDPNVQPGQFRVDMRPGRADEGQAYTLVKEPASLFLPDTAENFSRPYHSRNDFIKQSMPNLMQYDPEFRTYEKNPARVRHGGQQKKLVRAQSSAQFSAHALKRRLLLHKAETESLATSPTSSVDANGGSHGVKHTRKRGFSPQRAFTLPHCHAHNEQVPESSRRLLFDPRASERDSVMSQSAPRGRRQSKHYATWRTIYPSSLSQDRNLTEAEESFEIPSPMALVFNHKKEGVSSSESKTSSCAPLFKNSCV